MAARSSAVGGGEAVPETLPLLLKAGDPFVADLGNGVGLEFVWIPALRGWMGRYELTNEQYRRYMPRHRTRPYLGQMLDEPQQPVVGLPLEQGILGARPYAVWMTRRLMESGQLPAGWEVRVPTRSEWELAARCGDDRDFPWGTAWPPSQGNFADVSMREVWRSAEVIEEYRDGFVTTCPVELSGANGWGLYGMAGNAWEWTLHAEPGMGAPAGGSWMDSEEDLLKIGTGYRLSTGYTFEGLGVRLALMPVGSTSP